jgi:hypothetical protein
LKKWGTEIILQEISFEFIDISFAFDLANLSSVTEQPEEDVDMAGNIVGQIQTLGV